MSDPKNHLILQKRYHMTALKQAEELIPKLSDHEMSILLDYIFNHRQQASRGISKTPGVCGGRACMEGTRMPVWSLVHYRFLGFTDWEILYSFPTMTPTDLKNAWGYYEANKLEIDADILDNTLVGED